MPLPGGGTTRIKRCQSIWSNHTPRSMSIRWAMVHFGGMGSPNIYVTLVHLELDGTEIRQVHGWQELHRLVCKALGVDDSWFGVSAHQKNNPTSLGPP
jgi:hypothetical protein